jgi:hypothetical protein
VEKHVEAQDCTQSQGVLVDCYASLTSTTSKFEKETHGENGYMFHVVAKKKQHTML